MKELKIAVIATGFAGQQHTEAIRRIPGNQVAALVDTQADALKIKGKILGVEQVFTDYREMIAKIQPDVIHNCTPNGMHYEINKHIIQQGIHVYCEKPLAITVEEGRELVKLAQENQVAAGINFNYRHNAIVREMGERVRNGSVGRIFHITGQYQQDWMMLDTDYNWRLSAEIGGMSRTVADIGSHWFDTAQYVLGKRIRAVLASVLTVHPFRRKPASAVETFQSYQADEYEMVPIASEDAAFIHMRFEDGTIGSLNLSQVSGGHANDLRLEIAGERCSMEWQQQSPDVLAVGTRESGIQWIRSAPESLSGDAVRYATLPGGHPVAWTDALRNGIGEFYESVRSNRIGQQGQSYTTFADGVQIMEVVEACMQSARKGQWVEL